MAAGLLALEKTSVAEQPALVETIFRAAHSLKGAARAVNLTHVEAVCRSLENVFSATKRQAPRHLIGIDRPAAPGNERARGASCHGRQRGQRTQTSGGPTHSAARRRAEKTVARIFDAGIATSGWTNVI